MIEFGYLAIVLPKFNVVAVNKLLCLFPSFAIVSAVERNKLLEMAVPADDVNSILYHMRSPDQAGAQHSQSPIEADGETVMGTCSHVSWSALWSIARLAKSLTGTSEIKRDRGANDEEAIEKAKRYVDGHDIELWCGDRFVIRIIHKPKGG